MFHTTFIQIAEFDCLTGPHKGQFFEKNIQNSSPQEL